MERLRSAGAARNLHDPDRAERNHLNGRVEGRRLLDAASLVPFHGRLPCLVISLEFGLAHTLGDATRGRSGNEEFPPDARFDAILSSG
jgi:hypothetical protein